MKKINILLLTGIMSLLLTACGSSLQSDNASLSSASANTEDVSATPSVEVTSPVDASIPADIALPGKTAPSTTPGASTYNNRHTITVNSSEHIHVTPDIAQIVYSVRTQKSTAAECQSENNTAVSQVIELLKSLGVKEVSIQTSDYYMHPVYNYSQNTARVTGYEATTSLTVSDLPIENLDSILTESVSTGINTIQSITYQSSTYDAGYQDALIKASESAYQKAGILAAASGATLGKVISLEETSGYSQARYTDYARAGMINSLSAAKEEALSDSASIMPGEISVEAGLIVTYELIYQE